MRSAEVLIQVSVRFLMPSLDFLFIEAGFQFKKLTLRYAKHSVPFSRAHTCTSNQISLEIWFIEEAF